MIKINEMKVTDFDVLTQENVFEDVIPEFNVNVVLNGGLLLQLGTDSKWSFPRSDEALWSDEFEEMQDFACGEWDAEEVAEALKLPKIKGEWENFTI